MSFPTITHTIDGIDVEVSCEKMGETPNHRYKFTAKVGDTVYEHGMTVGSIDGMAIAPTPEQFQKDVDAARRYAAEHAHARHVTKSLESGIK